MPGIGRHPTSHAGSRSSLFLLALLALLALAGCRAESPEAGMESATGPDTLLPGSSRLSLPAADASLTWFAIFGNRPGDSTGRSLGRFGFGTFAAPNDGRLRLLVQQSPERGVADTLAVTTDGLTPVWEHLVMGDSLIRFDYAGARVIRTSRYRDTLVASDTLRAPVALFAFNQLDALLRSVPLERGFSTIVPLYSEGTHAFELDTVEVTAAPGSDGSDRVWTIRFADPVIVLTTTIRAADRAMVNYDITQRASGMHIRREETAAPSGSSPSE